MENVTRKKPLKPKTKIPKKNSISLLVGGENDEVQEHTDGNDAGSTKTDTSAS